MSWNIVCGGPELDLAAFPPNADSFTLTVDGVLQPLDVAYVADAHTITVETDGPIVRGLPASMTYDGTGLFASTDGVPLDPFEMEVSNPA